MPERSSRALWSGVLSFGLVSIPVELHSVVRPSPIRMRMLGPDGTPLRRRYRCPRHERLLEPDDIVRGHAEEDGSFLVVTDEELEALDPKRTREIDLKSFVPREQLSPRLFDRAYVLLPGGQSAKAYRLLAHTLETADRVGIASFVMRDRAYTIAISAQQGLLRAETLRDASEVREPADVGLDDAPTRADRERVVAFERLIDAMPLERVDLHDGSTEALLALAQEKQARGEAFRVDAPESDESDDPAQSVVDLMQLLKERLAISDADAPAASRPRKGPVHASPRATHPSKAAPDRGALEHLTRQQLYERAQALDLPGRSKMSKAELVDALADQESPPQSRTG